MSKLGDECHKRHGFARAENSKSDRASVINGARFRPFNAFRGHCVKIMPDAEVIINWKKHKRTQSEVFSQLINSNSSGRVFRGRELSRVERQELRVSPWVQMSANNMIAIKKPLCAPKNALDWSTLKFFAIFCNHLFDFFWNVDLKYEMHLAKLQKC